MGTMPFRQRDYYKISLCRGRAVLYTGSGEVEIDAPAIFFSSPVVPFGWKNISDDQQGFVCLFNELYVDAGLREKLKQLHRLFEDDLYPFLRLTDAQYDLLYGYFQKMYDEYRDPFEFPFTEAVIQDILELILYTGMKIRMSVSPQHKTEKPDLLVSRFLDMLDAQFPVDSPRNPIQLKTPADFARQLFVHVNHLNHTVKHYTGKPTSRLIQERRMAEALSLLKNTDWSISEIASSLGFEYPQYFNAFFRKLAGISPRTYRGQA